MFMALSLHKNIKIRQHQDYACADKKDCAQNAHQRASSLIHVVLSKVGVFHFAFSLVNFLMYARTLVACSGVR
jgi:hypothetical protein